MASTSTNKQPLLIDRPLHNLEVMDNRITGTPNTQLNGDLAGTNSAILMVDCTQNDGAVIECSYAFSRGDNGGNAWRINLYLSTQSDFLRQEAARYIGGFETATTAGQRTIYDSFPDILAPVPTVNKGGAGSGDPTPLQMRALYIPKGKALWAAINHNGTGMTTGPVFGVQGGYY